MPYTVEPVAVVHAARNVAGDDCWGNAQSRIVLADGFGAEALAAWARFRTSRSLTVSELDAIDGTPVLDIKPVMREFLPRTATHQPKWASELMRQYWCVPAPGSGNGGA